MIVVVDFLFLVVFVVVIVAGNRVLDALGETVAVESLGHILVLGDGGQEALVDGLAGVGLLDNAQHAVVQVLVELLCVGEGDGTCGAGTGDVLCAGVRLAAGWALFAAIGRILLDAVDRSEMSLEDIGAVKALLRCRAAAWTKSADHRALVVCECVSILVVLPREALDVVLACRDWALLGPLVLVGEHVCLEVLEDTATLGKWAKTLLARLIVQLVAAPTLA